MKKHKLNGLYILLFIFIMILLVLYPEICKKSVSKGIVFCSGVVIPSLFPLMVCSAVIMGLSSDKSFKYLDKISFKLLGISFNNTLIFIFSLFSGYPVGVRLINEGFKRNTVSRKTGRIMEAYCVNAGVGFIISAVGYNVYSSNTLGVILFFSHIASSLIMAVALGRFTGHEKACKTNKASESFGAIFCNAVTDSAKSIMNICGFIIIFSVINGFLEYMPNFKFLRLFLETTLALGSTKNLYLSSFLLGFGSVSIWCQLIAVSRDIGINFKLFFLSRLIHGGLSAVLTYIAVKTFKPSLPVFTGNSSISKFMPYSGIPLFISLGIMSVILIISLENKNNGGNLKEDLLK